MPNLPDEIRPLVILRHRCRNARRLADLDAPEHPRHVAAQVAHDLQALLVGENLLGLAAVDHRPVGRADERHLKELRHLLHGLQRRRRARAAGACHDSRGLVAQVFAAADGQPVHKAQHAGRRCGVVNRRAEHDAVGLLDQRQHVGHRAAAMPNTCVNYEKKCGGCPLLALPYREQLAQKQAGLQELLGGFAPVKAVRGMAEPLHYRNKAIASFATQRGKLVCGLYAEGTHRVLPGADCLLQEEILNKTLAAVLDAARACRWTAYDEDRGTGLLRHTVLRSSCGGKVLVTLVTPGPDLPGSKNFCTALRKKAPWVVSIVQNINPTRSSAVLGSREKTLYGPGFVLDTLCGTQFAISSRSFYQVNRTQTEVLYKKALELAKLTGRETVIDAYCGIGTIGLCAAPRAKQVIGVERNPAAVKDAAANARRNKIANARFVCADATEWMAAAAGEGLHPDVVFLDPPRAGSTPECIAAVNKMKPRRVVYVSCDPETLARDVAAFTRLGWRAAKFCPVDLFPQTKHVETVCLLVK